jgi:hypothetical protein
MVHVASPDEDLGEHELYLESVREDRSFSGVDGYVIQLRALNPNPAVVGQFDQEQADYKAALSVFEQDTETDYGY